MTDVAVWKLLLDVAQTIVLAGVAIYTWLSLRTAANKKQIDELDDRIARIEVGKLDGDDKDALHGRITELTALVAELRGVVAALKTQVETLTHVHMRHEK